MTVNAVSIRGLNHLTLAVRDLETSVAFYRDVLGFVVRAHWPAGAYLEAGALWLCLSVDPQRASEAAPDYTHIAFDVAEDQFAGLSLRIQQHARLWKTNSSEGHSLYFLGPDGHKLEIHVGSLASRLAHYRANTGSGVTVL